MDSQKKVITICDNHQKQYPTPLIKTFAFRGAELWCPFCGTSIGMFDGGIDVESTPELEKRKDEYKLKYSEYLHAFGVLSASKTEWEGEMIEPSNLPEKEKERLQIIRKTGWKPNIKIEDVKTTVDSN